MERPLTVGQLAHATGVPAKTIRYYEQVGVLPVPRRSGAGRNDNRGRGIELFLHQLATEDIIPLHVGCSAKFGEEREMRRAVCHGSAGPRSILNENEPA